MVFDGDKPEFVYAIHKLLKSETELSPIYETNKGSYKNLKEALIEDLDAFLSPMREKYNSITDADVIAVLKDGSNRARAIAAAKMEDVRRKIGVTL